MAIKKVYRLRCVTEEAWKEVARYVDEAVPTECPTNPAHTVDESATSVIDLTRRAPRDRDPAATDDESYGYEPDDTWVNSSSGQCFVCSDATSSAAVWGSSVCPTGVKDQLFEYSWSDGTFPSLSFKSVTFVIAAQFRFSGSDVAGTPTKMNTVSWSPAGGTQGCVRIWDTTNSKLICQLDGIDNQFPEPLDLGTISNIPTGAAVFEVQVRQLDGGKNINISSISGER
jgi:hypothetical protein